MVSFIIVHYHVKKELFECITSIYALKPKSAFEIIIVDNDEKKTIEKELKKKFPKVRYVKNDNKGYGQGNNVGASFAKGDYLFFLNPDTKVFQQTIDSLVTFLERHKDTGVVAPLLLGVNGKPYQQGSCMLTPLRAIFALSFINKIFPKNPISREYYLFDWDRKSVKEVDVVPGTAFMIRKELFEKLGGFDENFFLYFEEFDFCKRMKEEGFKLFITPNAKVSHIWGASTKNRDDINTIFAKSRMYYFRKHFGLLSALLTEGVLRFGKYTAVLLGALMLGAFLRLVHLQQSMSFIGDQGWFYLSARDMILGGQIPLVGIASSHPWLHQGAFWTYLLAPILLLFHFNPIGGAYLSVGIGLIAIYAIYRLGSDIFSSTVGIIAAALFATSPLVIASDRMPYHTSPIPLFTILALYCIFKWIRGNSNYFPLLILALATLYNFELATSLLSVVIGVIFIFGLITKKLWVRNLLNLRIVVLSFLALFVPMLPMLLYDVSHGFPQTLKLLVWVGYRVLVVFGYPTINPITPVSYGDMVRFVTESYQQLIFSYSGFVSLVLITASSLFLLFQTAKHVEKKPYILLVTVNLFLLVGLFVVKTPSEAYMPLIFPGVILLIAVLFDSLIGNKVRNIRLIGIIGLICLILSNSYYIFQKNSVTMLLTQRMNVATYIVKQAGEKEYTMIGRGTESKFASFTMNYEYLTWWLGHGPSKREQPLRFIISEENGEIRVEKEIYESSGDKVESYKVF